MIGPGPTEACCVFVDHGREREPAVRLAHQPRFTGPFGHLDFAFTDVGAAPDDVSEIDQPPTGADVFVPVDDADCFVAVKDDGVRSQTVVGNDFLPSGQRGGHGGVMEALDQPAGTDDLRVGHTDG